MTKSILDKFSVAELRKFADEKEAKENKSSKLNKDGVIKTGVLKHTLYCACEEFSVVDWYVTGDELLDAFDDYKKNLSKIAIGSKFVRFNDEDDCWYDDIGWVIEGMSDAWAKKHLTDIKEV